MAPRVGNPIQVISSMCPGGLPQSSVLLPYVLFHSLMCLVSSGYLSHLVYSLVSSHVITVATHEVTCLILRYQSQMYLIWLLLVSSCMFVSFHLYVLLISCLLVWFSVFTLLNLGCLLIWSNLVARSSDLISLRVWLDVISFYSTLFNSPTCLFSFCHLSQAFCAPVRTPLLFRFNPLVLSGFPLFIHFVFMDKIYSYDRQGMDLNKDE